MNSKSEEEIKEFIEQNKKYIEDVLDIMGISEILKKLTEEEIWKIIFLIFLFDPKTI